MSHPNGVQPSGNHLLHGGPSIRQTGAGPSCTWSWGSVRPRKVGVCAAALGSVPAAASPAAGLGDLAVLSDELLLGVLACVDARGLVLCGRASRALYCFCSHEELWRALTLQARALPFAALAAWRP